VTIMRGRIVFGCAGACGEETRCTSFPFRVLAAHPPEICCAYAAAMRRYEISTSLKGSLNVAVERLTQISIMI